MNQRALSVSLIIVGIGLAGCASDEQKLKDAGSDQLTGEEITALFSDAHESYESRDLDTTVTAESDWGADGSFRTEWQRGGSSGEATGNWWVEGDMSCVRFDQDIEPNPTCVKLYENGDGTYTSIWPDGKIHGVHTMTR